MVAWTPPVDVATAAPIVRRFAAAPGLHAGWIEGQRTFVRVTAGGTPRRTTLKRPWRTIGFDGRGRALTVTTVTSRRPCRGKRAYRLYLEVRRDRGRVQRLGDGCRNIGAPVLAVNRSGRAVLAWLEIPGPGAKKRVVVALGSTGRGLRAHSHSGKGDADGHAVAINGHGDVAVAFRRGSRMILRVRPAGRAFGADADVAATPQRSGPATRLVFDDARVLTLAWTDQCACGEAGMTAGPNPLRVFRGAQGGAAGPVQTLDAGHDIVGPPQVASTGGVSAVAWGTENGPGGTAVAVAHEGSFGAPARLGTEGLLTVDSGGTPMLATATTASRLGPRGWTHEPVGATGFPRALVTDPGGRTALLTQDGNRLRVSYRTR